MTSDETSPQLANIRPRLPRPGERSCPRCGAVFVCGNEAGADSCWCAALPPVLPLPGDASGCYCPDCLREIIEQQGQGSGAETAKGRR